MDNKDCCCCAREKTIFEIIAERVTDENELDIVIRHITRLELRNESLERQLDKERRFSFALTKQIAKMSFAEIDLKEQIDDGERDREFNWRSTFHKNEVLSIRERLKDVPDNPEHQPHKEKKETK